jgi:hypothetical protein
MVTFRVREVHATQESSLTADSWRTPKAAGLEWDLALAAFSWVPLHARHFVAAEGFTDFAARPSPNWIASRDSALSESDAARTMRTPDPQL